jgi:hypothetical protein
MKTAHVCDCGIDRGPGLCGHVLPSYRTRPRRARPQAAFGNPSVRCWSLPSRHSGDGYRHA